MSDQTPPAKRAKIDTPHTSSVPSVRFPVFDKTQKQVVFCVTSAVLDEAKIRDEVPRLEPEAKTNMKLLGSSFDAVTPSAFNAAEPFKHVLVDGFLERSFAAALREELIHKVDVKFKETKILSCQWGLGESGRDLSPSLILIPVIPPAGEFC